MKTDKEIFTLIHAQGEVLTGDLHIIDTTASPKCSDEDCSYRIYHNSGFCIDVQREFICDPDEVSQYDNVSPDGFNYSWFAEWEGFHSVANNDQLFKLLTTWINENILRNSNI